MTTLIAVNTRDAVVMGSDSLGTMSRPLVDPQDLIEYFETENGCKLKMDTTGQPMLDVWSKVMGRSQQIPYKYYTAVDKIFSLAPLEMGVMAAGIASIGDRSLKNLIAEFCRTDDIFQVAGDYTLKSVGERLLAFLRRYYQQQYPNQYFRPQLELMLCGYDKQKYTPTVMRIYVHEDRLGRPDYDFCVFFGGQTREIQRLVFGIDAMSKAKLIERGKEMLKAYHSLLTDDLRQRGHDIQLKQPEEFGEDLALFHGFTLEELVTNCGAFSEQTAIECIDFLVNVMIKSQQFSTQIPSVGGDVQVAVVKKFSGFNYISRREWRHGDSAVRMCD